jgi:hypothetical protein
VFRVVLDQYASRPELQPDVTTISQLVDAHTPEMARNVASSWELSERVIEALKDQLSERASQGKSPLGNSLRFGRLAGALAILSANGDVAPEVAKATLQAIEGASPQLDGIWARLSAKSARP